MTWGHLLGMRLYILVMVGGPILEARPLRMVRPWLNGNIVRIVFEKFEVGLLVFIFKP